MINKKRWLAWTAAAVIVTNTFTFLGTRIYSVRKENTILSKFGKLFEVRSQLYKYYDGPIDDNDLAEGAVKGMTEALKDPYTVFMTKKEFDEFNTQIEGNYAGIGVQVQAKEDKILIVDIFEDSPCKKLDVLPKDQIQKVNGTSVSGKDLEKAVTIMKGKEGTDVTLTLFREGKGTFDVKVKRKKIEIVTVKGEILDGNIGYMNVSTFDENTAKNFKTKLNDLKDKGMKSLIIDLRGNPGGALDKCIEMASEFVPKDKVIVSTVDKYKNKKEYKSKGGDFIGLPVTILTDEGSASASEIFSGALRDYKSATLVGDKTFGKGLVQVTLNSGDGTMLKVTISKWYTPNGENVNHTGIKPDVAVEYPVELRKKPYDKKTDPQLNKALEIAKDKIK